MPLWLQHTLVLTLVAACLAYALWQGLRALFAKSTRLGNCCAKGCSTSGSRGPATQRIAFLPADSLRRRR